MIGLIWFLHYLWQWCFRRYPNDLKILAKLISAYSKFDSKKAQTYPFLFLLHLSICYRTLEWHIKKVHVRLYIVRYPVLGTAQSTLQITPWQTCTFQHHLNFSRNHSATLQMLHEDHSFTNQPVCSQVLICTAVWTVDTWRATRQQEVSNLASLYWESRRSNHDVTHRPPYMCCLHINIHSHSTYCSVWVYVHLS